MDDGLKPSVVAAAAASAAAACCVNQRHATLMTSGLQDEGLKA